MNGSPLPKNAPQGTSEPARAEDLQIGGFAPFSTIDLPGAISAVVFCQGCAWRCGYCHNPHLIPAVAERPIRWQRIRRFLAGRKGLLDAVVFSGGEPILQPALAAALSEVRTMGFRTGLQTAGILPERLERLLTLVDWIGMDVKAPPPLYPVVTGDSLSGENAWRSAELALASGIETEFRTTVDPRVLDEPAVFAIAQRLAAMGVRRYVLQEMRPAVMLSMQPIPADRAMPDLKGLVQRLRAVIPLAELRSA